MKSIRCSFFVLLFFLSFYYDLNGQQNISELDYLTDDVETLKFRINELTKEIALLKTTVLKISGPDWNYKKGEQTVPAVKKKKENYVEIKGEKKQGVETGQLNSLNDEKKNSIVQFKNAAETVKPRKKAETRIDLNVVYESRPDIGKPIKYNLFCNDLKNKKNIKLLFSFNELMMFSQSASSENINLITKKNKSKDFIFNIKTGDKNLKVSFNAGNIGELRASVLVFEDSNNNNSPDQREIFNRQDINQTIGLED